MRQCAAKWTALLLVMLAALLACGGDSPDDRRERDRSRPVATETREATAPAAGRATRQPSARATGEPKATRNPQPESTRSVLLDRATPIPAAAPTAAPKPTATPRIGIQPTPAPTTAPAPTIEPRVVGPPGALLWSYDTGSSIEINPAVSGGVAYVTTNSLGLYAVDTISGSLLWKAEIVHDSDYVHYMDSSPTAADGMVYVVAENWGYRDGRLYALDARTGELIWRNENVDEVGYSPPVVDGKVYVSTDRGNLTALDGATGQVLWTYREGKGLYSPPAVVDGVAYVGSEDGYLYAVDAESGAYRFRYEIGDFVYSRPVLWEGVIFVGVDDDESLYALDAETGEILWKFETGHDQPWVSVPAVADGILYVGAEDGHLYALEAATGERIWSYETGSRIHSSPVVYDGVVYAGSRDGNLYALDAEDGGPHWIYETDGAIISSPSVVDGVVYIGSTDGRLYAFVSSAMVSDPARAVIHPTPAPQATSGPDAEVLVALYHATDGPNWTRSDKWLSGAPIGQWHGVAANSAGRVIRLNLSGNQLRGEIPPGLGNLSELRRLSLSNNQIDGCLPASLRDNLDRTPNVPFCDD